MKKKRNALRFVIFMLIALILLDGTGRFISVFAVNNRLFWRTADFYLEKRGSLDAVFVGPSTTYSYWDAPEAWDRYGIAVYPYSTAQQPLAAARFIIDECRKTQPDAVFLINLNMILVEKMSPARIHFLSDLMPPSLNRHRMIQYLCKIGGYNTPAEQLEYYFPIIAMHSRWKRLHSPFDRFIGRGCKGASVDPNFLGGAMDVTESFLFTDVRGQISEGVQKELDLLLDYLKEKSIPAAFVLSPASIDPEPYATLNAICDYLTAKGYPVYNGLEDFKEIGLDTTTDYFDFVHTNLRGAVKFTRWLGGRLVSDFGFSDKRGNPGYASWDRAVKEYARVKWIYQFI